MNILVIGNGFDLAHKLPTRYGDFLNFLVLVNRLKTYLGIYSEYSDREEYKKLDSYVAEYIEKKIYNEHTKYTFVADILKRNNDEVLNKIIELSKNNVWFKWFKEANINKNWIDFEAEISNVIQEIEYILKNYYIKENEIYKYKAQTNNDQTEYNKNVINNFLLDENRAIISGDIDEIKKNILDDLNDLIECLNIYLYDCVGGINNNYISPDIYDLDLDKVISFNYTNTFEKNYNKKKKVEYDYLHGKTTDLCTQNNMVLGIDEYLNEEEIYSNVNFIEFKKYFQRIHKRTGCIYKRWLEEINKCPNQENNVYFFGHSLSITDRDVIRDFLLNDNITSTIYYRSDKHYAELVTNIVKLIGSNCLIDRVYGTKPKIVFRRQAEMKNKDEISLSKSLVTT